jgi:hypothetical protein
MSNPAESVLRDPFRVILGLCLLDSGLRKQLEKTGSFEQLMSRMDGPIDAILSEQGRKLFYGSASNTISSDSVPNLTDEPLQKLEEDLLGRAAFARYLARRLESTEFHSGAYSIHLFGPWDREKHLLNFLKQELLTSRPNNGSAKLPGWSPNSMPGETSISSSVVATVRSDVRYYEEELQLWKTPEGMVRRLSVDSGSIFFFIILCGYWSLYSIH